MSSFWTNRPVLVTGGHGFLGRVVVQLLESAGATVFAPTHQAYDLTVPGVSEKMLAKYAPTHVIHLAARVGGIGYNQVAPAPLYFDNLMMGTHVIEAARTSGVEKLCCLEQSAVIPSSHQCPLLKHRYGMVIQKKQMRPTESLKKRTSSTLK